MRIRAGTTAALVLGLALPAAASAATSAPLLAVTPAGSAQFAWAWDDGTAEVLQARGRAANGAYGETEWLSPAGASATPAGIGTDASGATTVAWLTRGFESGHVRLRWRAADGTLRPTQTVSGDGSIAHSAQLAVDPAGNAHLVWIAAGTSGAPGAVLTRRRAAGGALGAIQTLSAPGAFARAPRVAVDPAGNAVFAWETQGSGGATTIYVRRRAAGGTLSTVRAVSATTGTNAGVALGVDRDGNAILAWIRRFSTASGVQLRRRAVDGTLGAVQQVAPMVPDTIDGPATQAVRIAVAPSGQATAAWVLTDTDAAAKVQVRRRTAAGGLGTLTTISTLGVGSRAPAIASDRYGNVTVAWEREFNAARVIQARRRSATGTLGPIHEISSERINADKVTVALDGAGTAILAWAGASDFGPVVQARTLTAAGVLSEPESVASSPSP